MKLLPKAYLMCFVLNRLSLGLHCNIIRSNGGKMENSADIIRGKGNLTRRDAVILAVLSVFVWLLAASSFGFLSAGFDNIYLYAGNDDLAFTSYVKQLIEQKWVWSTQRLGAPYGQYYLTYPTICLQNAELLLLKFWSLFTRDIPTVINLQLCFTFVLCTLTSYFVLRKMDVGYFLSVFGSLLFAFSPYIFGRSTEYSAHYCLAACYFIPLSVYLCKCCYLDDEFLKFNKKLFRGKTLLILIFCILIANNVIAYYPFFTCFLLCVTGLCKCLKTKRLGSFLPALKTICLIVIMMLAAVIPVFLYQLRSGSGMISDRNPHDLEYYSMKITQLFIPLFSHGINFLQNFIDEYNKNMPAVNENKNAYLGVIAGIGFLISMLYFFFPKKDREENEYVSLFSRLNLASVLFMTIGGFMSLFSMMLGMFRLRSVNRISIYIMFISLALVCSLLQRHVIDRLEENSAGRGMKFAVYLCLSCLMSFGIWEQTPQLYSDGTFLQANRAQWESDKKFVSEIESQLQPGDMIYQIPYHEYPEGRSIHKMGPYHPLVGYVHSETLKWSYGGLTGSKAADWYEYMNRISTSVQKLVDNVTSFGFKGIYIDSRGYEEEELETLLRDFQNVLGYEPLRSENGNLYFYNLYPYGEGHE